MAHLFIIINENSTEYSSNVTFLCANYRNKYISTVSSKKIIDNMFFFYRINFPPPPPPALVESPRMVQTISFDLFLSECFQHGN